MTSQSSTKNGTGVTHLPECHYVKDTDNVQYGWNDCICPELRACEQRVLDAAEKAVADIDGEEMCCACNDDYRMTIAAIRALKEKS